MPVFPSALMQSVGPRLTLPSPRVRIRDWFGFHTKSKVVRVDPELILRGFDNVAVQNAPESASADRPALLDGLEL
jgi:hypothetical protein